MIGGSHGGFDLLRELLPALGQPRVPTLLCLHLPRGAGHEMAQILSTVAGFTVSEARHGQLLEPRAAYLAPGGYQLLVERDYSLSLSADGPVNHAQPSIDVLFESAALACGRGVLAVLLTGASSDGARGLFQVHQLGGSTVVQDPETARSPVMPRAALDLFQPKHTAAPEQLPELIQTWLDQ